MSVRTELDSLHAALFHMRQELSEVQRNQGIHDEETYKRLVWYSHLERLAVVAIAFCAGKRTREDLDEIVAQVKSVHRFVSPGVRTPEQEAVADEEWRKPA